MFACGLILSPSPFRKLGGQPVLSGGCFTSSTQIITYSFKALEHNMPGLLLEPESDLESLS